MKVYTSKSIRELFEMKTSFENGFAFFMEKKLKIGIWGGFLRFLGGKRTKKRTKKRKNDQTKSSVPFNI